MALRLVALADSRVGERDRLLTLRVIYRMRNCGELFSCMNLGGKKYWGHRLLMEALMSGTGGTDSTPPVQISCLDIIPQQYPTRVMTPKSQY